MWECNKDRMDYIFLKYLILFIYFCLQLCVVYYNSVGKWTQWEQLARLPFCYSTSLLTLKGCVMTGSSEKYTCETGMCLEDSLSYVVNLSGSDIRILLFVFFPCHRSTQQLSCPLSTCYCYQNLRLRGQECRKLCWSTWLTSTVQNWEFSPST